jgi:aminoglycoside phosphotransferase (APT) family kinase protein
MVIRKVHPSVFKLGSRQTLFYERQFTSRKNPVYLVRDAHGHQFVLKYSPLASKEVNVLQALRQRGVPVPQVLRKEGECFLMEYIPGPTLCDFLEEQETMGRDFQTILHILVLWLHCFYQAFPKEGIILGDPNLRNFIFIGCIYGIDFESLCYGRPEEDLGRVCAFLLTYKPAFTPWKKRAAAQLWDLGIRELNLDPGLALGALQSELKAMEQRRNQVMPSWLGKWLKSLQ